MSSSSASNGGTRRDLLAALGCVVGVWALLPKPAFWAAGTDSVWLQTLQFLIFRPQVARALGELYRQHFPDDDLLEISSMTVGQLRNGLVARIRRDFAHGDTVQLQGWILSRTEARLCALYP